MDTVNHKQRNHLKSYSASSQSREMYGGGSSEYSDDNYSINSLFQGDNVVYPSRRTPINIERQQKHLPVVECNEDIDEGDDDQLDSKSTDLAKNMNLLKLSPSAETEQVPSTSRISDNRQSDECDADVEVSFSEELRKSEAVENAEESSAAASLTTSLSRNSMSNLKGNSPSNLIAFGRKPQNPKMISISSRRNREKCDVLGWQAEKSNLRDRIGYMFCNELLSDVYFIVGNDQPKQSIPAHKFILSIGSVVFDAMFNGGLTPSHSDEPLEIELPDVEPSAFLTLLKYFYTDEVVINPDNVMSTLYTAKKYAVPAVEQECVAFLEKRLEADNAFMLLSQAKLFEEKNLEIRCLEEIDFKTVEALNGEGFNEIDIGTLCEVLSRDTLRIRELHLFQAIVRWSEAECERRGIAANAENKRESLGRALNLIRYPLMKIDEFAIYVEPTKLLPDSETIKIFKYLALPPCNRPIIIYSDKPRCCTSATELVVSRYQRTETRWGYCDTPDRIKFTVDKRIFVVGLGLYGSLQEPHEYKVEIKIIHCGTCKTLAKHDTSFVSDGTPKPFRIYFKEPVEIVAGITYIASACIKQGPDSFYGIRGLRRILHKEAGVTFQFTYAAVNNNGTSVEEGQIPEILFYPA